MAETALELRGLDGVLDMLQRLPAEVVSKQGGPVKLALRAGARVVLKAEQEHLKRVLDPSDGDTGLLLESLVARRGKPPSDGKGERYIVGVKNKSYGRKGEPVTTLKTAQLKEYGSSQQPATPWIRPAFAQSAENAIRTIETDLPRRVEAIAAKLAKQGGA